MHWTERRANVADGLLAVAIAAASAASALADSPAIVAEGPSTSIVGPHALVAAVYLLAGLALAFRRRTPLAVFFTVVALLTVPVVAYGGSEGFGPFAALLVALYTVGAHCERGQALLALGTFTGFWVLLEARDPLNHDVGDMLGGWPVYLLYLIVWLGGSYVRTRRLYLEELRYRVESAETAQAERIQAARADERARIARELHDAVAHALTVMVMQAEAADEVFHRDPGASRRAIESIGETGREGLGEMRRLVGILREGDESARTPQPGLRSLPELLETVRETGLAVEVTLEGTPRPLPPGIDISAYRIVQEALTNAIKHAHATAVRIVVRYGDAIELEVVDNGAGPARQAGDGHGLVGMGERVALYGGTLTAGAAAGGGFHVRATLPTVVAS